MEDCEKVSNSITELLDKEDVIPEQYFLEVSSPGIERTLKREKHLKDNIGNEVQIKLFKPFEGKKQYKGILKDFVELEDEVEEQFGRSICLKNALKIENWCKENFGEKEKWERRLPSKGSKDEEEKRLATALSGLMKKKKQ